VLALVVCLLVLTLAYPARQYLADRSQISETERAQAAQRERIEALEERREQWKDPAYVTAQARQRLQLVKPGEVAYVITEAPGTRRSRATGSQVGRVRTSGPWYGKLWSSVEAADAPAQGPVPPR